MRVNIYAEEMPEQPRLTIIEKKIDDHTFTALRIYLELPASYYVASPGRANAGEIIPAKIDDERQPRQLQAPFIHRPGDDDSSAVTFWGKRDVRETLVKGIELLDAHYYERSKGKLLAHPSIPRRAYTDCHSPAETAIRRAILAVEAAGADPRLTDAINLLAQAGEKVADYVDLPRS